MSAISRLSRALAIYLGKLTSNLDANGQKIENMAAPTADTDAATKKYVDDTATGGLELDYEKLKNKPSVGGVTIDGAKELGYYGAASASALGEETTRAKAAEAANSDAIAAETTRAQAAEAANATAIAAKQNKIYIPPTKAYTDWTASGESIEVTNMSTGDVITAIVVEFSQPVYNGSEGFDGTIKLYSSSIESLPVDFKGVMFGSEDAVELTAGNGTLTYGNDYLITDSSFKFTRTKNENTYCGDNPDTTATADSTKLITSGAVAEAASAAVSEARSGCVQLKSSDQTIEGDGKSTVNNFTLAPGGGSAAVFDVGHGVYFYVTPSGNYIKIVGSDGKVTINDVDVLTANGAEKISDSATTLLCASDAFKTAVNNLINAAFDNGETEEF